MANLKTENGWQMSNYQLRAALGITGKLGPEGKEPVMVDNVKVWVLPQADKKFTRGAGTHRVVCACPRCGKTTPAGRLHQHFKACKE